MTTKLEKVKLNLIGLDGNAFNLLGQFQHAARKQGWPQNEIDKILAEAKTKDYNHLIVTISQNCEDPNDDND